MSKKFVAILKEIKAIHEEVSPVQVKLDKIKPATDAQIEAIEKVMLTLLRNTWNFNWSY